MKQPIKILILVVAILLAVGGVLYFMHTILAPPMPENRNQFVATLEADTIVINRDDREKGFAKFKDELFLFQKEEVISSSEYDKAYEQMISTYTPLFLNWCFERFSASEWYPNDHKFMLSRISMLQSADYSNGKPIIERGSSPYLRMDHIKTIIQNYKDAWAATRVKGFTNLKDANERIQKAKSYKNKDYLSNCTSLMQAINNVSSKLENAHYSYLKGQVERLWNYSNYSDLDSYDKLVDEVDAKLDEYKNNAQKTYGKSRDVEPLKTQGGKIYERAYIYFNNRNKPLD